MLVPSSSVTAVVTKSAGFWRAHCCNVTAFSSGEDSTRAAITAMRPTTIRAMTNSLARS